MLGDCNAMPVRCLADAINETRVLESKMSSLFILNVGRQVIVLA